MMKIQNIYVLGGTHGNEITGAYVVKNWDSIFSKVSLKSSVNIKPILSNPKAFSQKVRYIDKDLNRVFSTDNLRAIENSSYEDDRARSLNALMGPKPNDENFIIDMHTTNSAMGITLMTSSHDIFKLNLIKYIADNVAGVNVIYTEDSGKDRPFLNSITKHSLLVEIGGVANNILNHEIFEKTINVVKFTISFIDDINSGNRKISDNLSIPAFTIIKKIKFPRDNDGNLLGMIHKDLQDKDFHHIIRKGDNIFKLFNGETIKLEDEGEFYASFINESAYYIEDTAFYLMRKTNITTSQ